MKSLVCTTPGSFEWQEQGQAPPVPAAGEVVVKVAAVGVCGTDYHAFRGKQPYFEYPRILGHEIAGVIADAGSGGGSPGLQQGDAVAVMPYMECGACAACLRGRPNACERLQVLGVHIDGAMRPYITVPASHAVPAAGLSLSEIAIIEPLSIGLHAVNRAQAGPGQVVLVIGAGPIGLAAMKFAKLAGAKVIALDTNQERLAFCRRWAGVDAAIGSLDQVEADLRAACAELALRGEAGEVEVDDGEQSDAKQSDASNGDGKHSEAQHSAEHSHGKVSQSALSDGADCRRARSDYPTAVIDATGNAASMMNAFHYAAHGGVIVYVSLVQADITFSDPLFHKKELSLLASRAATREEFDHVIAAMRAGHIDAEGFITHRAPFAQAAEAFQQWLAPGSVIKAVIEF